MKYVIDVGEKFTNADGDALYRVRGFKSLVFDQYDIDYLTPYDESKTYKRGYKDGYGHGRRCSALSEYMISLMVKEYDRNKAELETTKQKLERREKQLLQALDNQGENK